jgi:polyisoprenoid-binding protein YceI
MKTLKFSQICQLIALMLLVTLFAFPVSAELRRYRIDPVHTRVVFLVQHAGFSRSIGQAIRPTGKLWWDSDAPERSRVDVEIDAAKIDFGDAAWNKAMQGKRYFNVKQFKAISFKSIAVRPGELNKGQFDALVTILGIQRKITLDYTLNKSGKHPMLPRAMIGFSARGTLRRSSFGMDHASDMIGDEVELWIEVEASLDPEFKPARK